MKKLILFVLGITLGLSIHAQPWLGERNARVKLSEVITDYKNSTHTTFNSDKSKPNNGWDLTKLMKGEKEADYRFNKWLWYWKQHTDTAGYLVSPVVTWNEWNKFKIKNNIHTANKSTSTSLTWTFQGPDSSGAFVGDGAGAGVGRINIIAFHPSDSNTFIIGSPGGGAWKTVNNGNTWTCLTDQLSNLSVSDIKFNPLNPNTIYMCTGDRDGGDYYGIGVLKSYDGGVTWNTTGITWSTYQLYVANSILVNPLDTNSLILGTTQGVYRSYNGGDSWVLRASGNFTQLVYKPNDTNIVYAGTLSYSGSAHIYRSSNGGSSWISTSSFTQVNRVSVAVTPANSNLVMAITSSSSSSNYAGLGGIYKSVDTGHTFVEVYTGDCSGHDLLGWNADASDCYGQGTYDLSIAISPLNANDVFIGGVNAWKSTNGGVSWEILNQWATDSLGVASVHADKHYMCFNPLSPARFFETNDGGVYSAYNASSIGVWTNLTNGLGITEFYGVAITGASSFVMAGAQDEGTKLINHGLYEEADGGDGMWAQLDPTDATIGYASSEYGYIDILDPTATQPDATTVDISVNIAGGSVEGNGSWVTPFMIEPACHTCLLAGYSSLYKTTDKGNSWSAISGNLSTGGYTLGRIATTIADSNTIFVTEDASGMPIHYTHNMGTTWSTLSVPYSSVYVSDIKIDPRDKNHIWVTFSGYGINHVADWSSTGGWNLLNDGLPNVPVQCIAINQITREMYLGTDVGVFYRDSTMSAWVINSSGLPVVRVTDIEINYATGEIWASTYGRSLWNAIMPSSVSLIPFVNNCIQVYPNPNNGTFEILLNNIDERRVNFRLYDITGKIVWEQKNVLNVGSRITVNVPDLLNGMYILEVNAKGAIDARQKIIISK